MYNAPPMVVQSLDSLPQIRCKKRPGAMLEIAELGKSLEPKCLHRFLYALSFDLSYRNA